MTNKHPAGSDFQAGSATTLWMERSIALIVLIKTGRGGFGGVEWIDRKYS